MSAINSVLRSPFLAGSDHNRRSVRVVRANEDTSLSLQPLIADPDIGLNVLDEVAEVDVTIGIG